MIKQAPIKQAPPRIGRKTKFDLFEYSYVDLLLAKQELLCYADAARLGEITADREACSMLEGVSLWKDNNELMQWAGWLPQTGATIRQRGEAEASRAARQEELEQMRPQFRKKRRKTVRRKQNKRRTSVQRQQTRTRKKTKRRRKRRRSRQRRRKRSRRDRRRRRTTGSETCRRTRYV